MVPPLWLKAICCHTRFLMVNTLDNTKMRGCGEMRAVVKEENFGWLISECNPIPGLPLGGGRE